MKRILLHSTLALTLAASSAFAQQGASPTDTQNSAAAQQSAGRYGRHHQFDPHKAAQHMSKKLGLSQDQTAKLEPILSENQQKVQALRADTSLTPDQRKEQMKAIHQNMQTQLSSVLTPDQMQQLRSMRRNFRGGRRGPQQQQSPDTANPPSGN